jgi:arginyl-tRNA synthetase
MEQEITTQIKACLQQLFTITTEVELTRPDPEFGDYATNIALQLAKQLSKNPRDIAEQLAESLRAVQHAAIVAVSVAGPGFINLKLSDTALVRLVQAKTAPQASGQIVLAEYSDPNPFKPLHAGHLYTTLVGDAIARLLAAAGAQVTRINYGGDVGLHVGKSMWAIDKYLNGAFPEKLADIPQADRSSWLGERYIEGNNAYEEDVQAKTEIVAINKRVYALHEHKDHTSAFAQIYWTCRQWSYDSFEVLYQQLQVLPFDRILPESEIVTLGLQTVREQLVAGVYENSDGAVVYRGEAKGLHTRVFINSAGLPTYEAKDVGLLLTKWRDYHFDRSIVITANEQAEYMRVMLASVAEFEPEAAIRSEHLTHGVVKLQGGQKMSSRKGNVVSALHIIAAATAANIEVTGKESPDTVLGAIKYAFLKNRIGGDILYDPKESVSLEGNSGPYLQYAHVRARSILRKASLKLNATHSSIELQPDERILMRKLGEYTETVDLAIRELLPHYICTYLYELAQTFNRFYENNRVINHERQAERLQLVSLYANTLKQGLELLGIPVPEQM